MVMGFFCWVPIIFDAIHGVASFFVLPWCRLLDQMSIVLSLSRLRRFHSFGHFEYVSEWVLFGPSSTTFIISLFFVQALEVFFVRVGRQRCFFGLQRQLCFSSFDATYGTQQNHHQENAK